MASRYLADISGQLNAAGVGFATSEPMLIWTKAVVTAQAPASSNAVWTVGIGTHTGAIYHQLAFGVGASISCGPYTLAPGEVLVVSITAGGVSDSIRASLFGIQDVNPNAVGMDTAVGSATSVQISGGVVNISGTVPVSVAGTVNVNVSSGTVAISGTVPVSIAGTVAVNIGSSGTVAISGTVPVTISSGTVSISGTVPVSISSGSVSITGTANISIVAQTIQVGVQLAWAAAGSAQSGLGGFTTPALPAGTQTLAISLDSGITITALLVQGLTSGVPYERAGTGQISGGFITIPVNPALDAQYVISWSGSGTSLVRAFSSAAFMGYPALGQNPMGESVPVVIAQDQTAVSVTAQLGERIINQIPSASRAIGTYNNPINSARTDFAGIAVYGKATAGAGTCTYGIAPQSLTNFISPGSILTSGATAAGQVAYLRMYPGLPNVANSSANDLCGLAPVIQLVVSGANLTSQADVDLIP